MSTAVSSHTRRIKRRGGTRLARHSLEWVGQVGWFAKGAVYTIAGLVAATLAAKSVGWRSTTGIDGEASPTGAIKEVASLSGGRILLFGLAFGLLVYAAWRAFTALAPGGHGAEASVKRAGYLVSAVLYVTFAVTAIALARRPGSTTDGNAKVSDLTGRILAHTSGRWLVALIGVIALGAGIYRLKKGVTGDVEDELDLSGLRPSRRSQLHLLGVVGEIGRGIAIGLIGVFLFRAGVDAKAGEATGLDGALRRLAQHTWGALLVAIVAVGFVAYGVFCLSTCNRRRLRATT